MWNSLTAWYRRLRGRGEDEFAAVSIDELELWSVPVRHVVRLLVVFLLLFAGVFAAFRWSGAAVRFGSLRVGGQAAPTWQVAGVVTDGQTRQPVPWGAGRRRSVRPSALLLRGSRRGGPVPTVNSR